MSKYLEWKKRAIIMSAGGWWLPSAFSSDNVLAVYQFKGANSEKEALTDLTGHGYDLTGKDFEYSESEGFYSGTVTQDALTEISSTKIKSVVIRYKNFYTYLDNDGVNHAVPLVAMEAPVFYLYYKGQYGVHGNDEDWADFGGGILAMHSVTNGSNDSGEYQSLVMTTSSTKASVNGTVGYSKPNNLSDFQLYKNGTVNARGPYSVTSWHDGYKKLGNSNQPVIAQKYNASKNRHNLQILAAAFYSVALTDDQHQEISDAVNRI